MRQVATLEEDIEVYDLLSVDWRSTQLLEGADKLRTTKREALKAYMIADSVYNIPEYLDLLLFINNVADPFKMYPNQELSVPKEPQVKDFLLRMLQKV